MHSSSFVVLCSLSKRHRHSCHRTSFFFSAPGAWPGKPAPPLCPWPIDEAFGRGGRERESLLLLSMRLRKQEKVFFFFASLSLLVREKRLDARALEACFSFSGAGESKKQKERESPLGKGFSSDGKWTER